MTDNIIKPTFPAKPRPVRSNDLRGLVESDIGKGLDGVRAPEDSDFERCGFVAPNTVSVPVEELQAMRVMAVRLIHFIDCRLEHHFGDDDQGGAA